LAAAEGRLGNATAARAALRRARAGDLSRADTAAKAWGKVLPSGNL